MMVGRIRNQKRQLNRRKVKPRITKVDVERARKGFQESLERTRKAGSKIQMGLEAAETRRRALAPRVERIAERADVLADRIEREGGFTGFGKSRPIKRTRKPFPDILP